MEEAIVEEEEALAIGGQQEGGSAASSNVTAFLSKLWRLVNDTYNNNLVSWSQVSKTCNQWQWATNQPIQRGNE